ncbi:hypothetical protein BCT96_001075 [Vibrio splendidus]|uniref:transcriptional regulator n=1 Tax=Vibrio splendidus TaxID=29497 RepID=UPI000C865B5A|nr:transcriptional regulator [Vibrio splendidus]PMI76130.1 hypothetical protein BCU37_22800 [Vibrio splendidus]PMK60975.1 hypothetical protein BCT96_01915 [Vibrio splendidus]
MSEPSLIVSLATIIDNNKEWLFSGVGLVLFSLVANHLFRGNGNPTPSLNTPDKMSPQPAIAPQPVINVKVENHNESKAENNSNPIVEGSIDQATSDKSELKSEVKFPSGTTVKDEDYFKKNTTILIIDDEVQFKLPKIFRDSGWINTKLVPDVNAVNASDIVDADILFVDVQGVGKELGFKDEGLGLVAAIKTRYPNKKVIIYSVIAEGNRFHEAFNLCDGCLSKDADPYQFECLVEKFTIHRGLYE